MVRGEDANYSQQCKAVAAHHGCRVIRKPKQADRNRNAGDGETGMQNAEQEQRDPSSCEQFGIGCAFVESEEHVGVNHVETRRDESVA